MPSDKLQQVNMDFHIEIADISVKDAKKTEIENGSWNVL